MREFTVTTNALEDAAKESRTRLLELYHRQRQATFGRVGI